MSNYGLKWSDYELITPEWLWLIPVFIIINLLFKIKNNKFISKSEPSSFTDISHKKKELLHPLISGLAVKIKTVTNKPTKQLLHGFIFILLTIALSQPVHIGEKLPEPPQERDIIFIVDTSVSMILRDYIINGERIDRMSLLKGVLHSFIRKLKGERMSIIVFGDRAYTLVPFTADQHLLLKMLSRIEATMAGRFNAIGDAIALAVKQAVKTNSNDEQNIKRKRILVLLTDADQPTGDIDLDAAAEFAKNENLPLYTIAIGSTNIAAEEIRKGGLIYSPVDLNIINRLSNITGGKSYQAGDPDAFENAIQSINLHETNKRQVEPMYFHESLYHWFLIFAFILFSIGQLINVLKTLLNKSHSINFQVRK